MNKMMEQHPWKIKMKLKFRNNKARFYKIKFDRYKEHRPCILKVVRFFFPRNPYKLDTALFPFIRLFLWVTYFPKLGLYLEDIFIIISHDWDPITDVALQKHCKQPRLQFAHIRHNTLYSGVY